MRIIKTLAILIVIFILSTFAAFFFYSDYLAMVVFFFKLFNNNNIFILGMGLFFAPLTFVISFGLFCVLLSLLIYRQKTGRIRTIIFTTLLFFAVTMAICFVDSKTRIMDCIGCKGDEKRVYIADINYNAYFITSLLAALVPAGIKAILRTHNRQVVTAS